jgi:hypothetical protein
MLKYIVLLAGLFLVYVGFDSHGEGSTICFIAGALMIGLGAAFWKLDKKK